MAPWYLQVRRSPRLPRHCREAPVTWPCPEPLSQGTAAGMPPFTSASCCLAQGAALPTMLVPGDPRGCVGLSRHAGRHQRVQAPGAGGHGLAQPPGMSSHALRTMDPARICPECTRCRLAALPRLPFIFFLQASKGKPLPLLCQPLLSHRDGSLGPSSYTSGAACHCLRTPQPGLGREHLSPPCP